MERMPTVSSQKLNGIQALRAIAVLLVLWAHLKFAVIAPTSRLLETGIGAIGVDIFFVISGFVISMTASKSGDNWRLFAANRISRIVPLYYLFSLFFIVKLMVEGKLRLPALWNSFFFLPFLDIGVFSNPALAFGWSLSFEMWFYIAFTFVLACSDGKRASVILPAVLTAGVVLAAFLYRYPWYLPKFLFHPFVLEFSAGCLLYHVRERVGKKEAVVISMIGIVLLAFWGSGVSVRLSKHGLILANIPLGFLRTLLWGGFSACLVGLILFLDLRQHITWPKPLVTLGDASYSLYLFQLIALFLTQKIVPGGGAMGGIVFALSTVLGGLLVWKYVERPITVKCKPYMKKALGRTR